MGKRRGVTCHGSPVPRDGGGEGHNRLSPGYSVLLIVCVCVGVRDGGGEEVY